jgi:galactose mutarotase-like enzyme
VEGGGLRLEIRYGDGYDHAQVFSPRARDFVAVEPMASATDALTRDECPLVAPGSRFAATFEIAVG